MSQTAELRSQPEQETPNQAEQQLVKKAWQGAGSGYSLQQRLLATLLVPWPLLEKLTGLFHSLNIYAQNAVVLLVGFPWDGQTAQLLSVHQLRL